ncbi:hypothetical protein Gotur_017760, partial [Gossypium turneri]
LQKLSPNTNYTSTFHTLSHVVIRGYNKLVDRTWLILAPNLCHISIFGCAKLEKILSERKLGEITNVVGIPYLKPFLKLKTLALGYLPELKSIYWDALPFPVRKGIISPFWEAKIGGQLWNGRMKPLEILFYALSDIFPNEMYKILKTALCFVESLLYDISFLTE